MNTTKAGHVFEISWEVCNMVGGIHTVLISKAAQMRQQLGDNYVCVGPYVPHPISSHPVFREEIWDDSVYKLLQDFSVQGVSCRMGRWLIPSEPKVLLVGFRELFPQKDRILAHYWEKYGVNSLLGGHDYVEPVLFGHAAGLLVEQIYNRSFFPEQKPVLVHAHEWMTAVALLHLKQTAPEIATVFTTHATILGRSLSSRDATKPLPRYLKEKPASVWAEEVGIESKHSVEVVAAREADCFTTVSQTTSDECQMALGKAADLVVCNGLSDDVPEARLLQPEVKAEMRQRLLQIAASVTGAKYDPAKTYLMATSGRYEFRNKGIDLYLDSLLEVAQAWRASGSDKRIVAFVMCPAGHGLRVDHPSPTGISTHHLIDGWDDPVVDFLHRRLHHNSAENPLHVVFLPLYLNGTDPSLPETYWELLSGVDLAAFPSWYEPWGYTPHEAIALGIPTITSNCAGFGRWVQALPGEDADTGVIVVNRVGEDSAGGDEAARGFNHDYDEAKTELKNRISEFLLQEPAQREAQGRAALQTAKKLRWGDLIEGYKRAYALASERAASRVSKSPRFRFRSFSFGNLVAPSPFSHARASVRDFSVTSPFPAQETALRDFMDRTISWRWNPKVTQLLSNLDPALWQKVERSPAKFIKNANDEAIKRIYESPVLTKIFEGIKGSIQAGAREAAEYERGYFCMEFAISDKLRIYSGGLGILAGDHLKTASDMKIPIAAFGLFYQYGYFRQGLTPDGQQLAHYDRSELEALKLALVQDADGGRLLLSIPFGEGEESNLYFQAWRLDLHGVHLYLLDSNVMENPVRLRNVSDRLYGSEPGKRISQEWLLSMGGLELIKRLKIPIKVFHMNEGHTAFLVFGRILDLMEKQKLTLDEAYFLVRFSTIFTTHTPVAAGHDEFALEEALAFIRRRTWDPAILERIVSLSASLKGAGGENRFSMTGLAFRGSRWVNAVSQIHQRVSQGMFNNLYPDLEEKEVPVGHVTNGAHVPFWAAPEWQSLFFETLGEDWPQRLRDVAYWRQLEKVPLERFAEIKLVLKNRLVDWIRKRLGQELAQDGHRQSYAEVLARLDSRTLIIGHAKRMAPYKRADLLFQDAEALHELLQKSPVPILFIYAGKAHPSDGLGQEILQKITAWSRDPRFKGSVLLLEDYDLSYARRLIAGVDVWLNTPLRPLEASGTSGMKAAMNGTLHFSIADGWWPEAYNGRNGWMVGDGSELWDQEEQDSFDRRRILHILEHDILPEFTNLGEGGWSRPWAARMRESIASVVPSMSSERMLEDYQSRLYKPALRAAERLEKDGYAELKALVGFKQMLRDHWDQVEFAAVDLDQLGAETVQRGEATEMSVTLAHPGLSATHIQLQAILGRRVGHRQPRESRVVPLECVSDRSARDRSKWRLALDNAHSGEYTLALRAIPQAFPGLEDPAFELKMVKWM